jgi:hypothetical protein
VTCREFGIAQNFGPTMVLGSTPAGGAVSGNGGGSEGRRNARLVSIGRLEGLLPGRFRNSYLATEPNMRHLVLPLLDTLFLFL